MAEFNFPEWRLGPEPAVADLPPPEYAEADAVREQQLNDEYLAGQRQILNQGEGAYYRQQGEAAIHAAPPALEALQQLKDDTLAQAGNDRQREALSQRLDWHYGEAQRGISRHLAGQADAWRQAVADNQVKTADEEAAVNHNDPAKVDLLAAGAYTIRLRSAGQLPGAEAAQASAADARSSVYRRAIEAALAAGDTRSALGLYERAKDRLTAGDAAPMRGQIKAVTQRETAQTYLASLETQAPSESSTFLDAPKQLADADTAHQAATARNDSDWTHDPSQRAINQHYIDVQFGQQKQEIVQAKAQLNSAVGRWVATSNPDGRPQTNLPPPALWSRLSPDEQQSVLAALKRNAFGPEIRPATIDTPVEAASESADGPNVAQLPPVFFGRPPPVVLPRPLTPLEELPEGSAGGPGAGKPFPRSARDEVPEGAPCTYCKQPTTKKEPGPDQLNLDHVKPKKEGGDTSPGNRAPSCRTCNLQKGGRTPEEWYNWREVY